VKGGRGVVIAGGGTAGHVVPSLQIARALVDRGHSAGSVELYGSRRGQESAVWPPLEFPYTLLAGRGIRRSVRPAALWANLGAVLGLLWAVMRAVASFAAHRPRAVVVVGGYASFAAAVAAVVTRVPLVLVHIDAVPGAVSGLFSRFAVANTVAFAGMDLPRMHVTGTPIRPELTALDRSDTGRRHARSELGLPADRQTVTSFGGSLGAGRINTAVADLARRWSDCEGISVFHVTGRRDFEKFALPVPSAGAPAEHGAGLRYEVVAYEDRMPEFFRAADVCVCRAGANTVAELSVTGVPAILVPLPGAPRDHQTHNARALVQAGAAVLIPDPECDGQRLSAELNALLADPVRLAAMGEAARGLGHADAAARIAELVDAHAR
jgi:UDP-N-acetylglucosamine--N-acetylmuramyl-(pentapeptide) pyrophosphoryl-undecaprenol N-acetylglucosamine transferase